MNVTQLTAAINRAKWKYEPTSECVLTLEDLEVPDEPARPYRNTVPAKTYRCLIVFEDASTEYRDVMASKLNECDIQGYMAALSNMVGKQVTGIHYARGRKYFERVF